MFWNLLLSTSYAAATAKSLQSCPTLCDPIDGSPPGSPVPGILQARTLEWVAISFSNAWKWKVKVKSLSHVRLLATPWTAAYHASLSMGFSRQEYWSGVPLPSPIRANLSFSGRLHKMYIGFWIKVTTSIYKSKIITRKMGTGKFYVYLPIFFFQYICLSWETCPENYLMNRMS